MMFTNTFKIPNHGSLVELPVKNSVYTFFQTTRP